MAWLRHCLACCVVHNPIHPLENVLDITMSEDELPLDLDEKSEPLDPGIVNHGMKVVHAIHCIIVKLVVQYPQRIRINKKYKCNYIIL